MGSQNQREERESIERKMKKKKKIESERERKCFRFFCGKIKIKIEGGTRLGIVVVANLARV